MSNRPDHTVAVVSHDSDWPRRFAAERDLLAGVVGEIAIAIEHVAKRTR